MAMLPTLFAEVYVRDSEDRIRVYQELGGRAMADLTKRYEPACQRL
jgi:hypothetical protein